MDDNKWAVDTTSCGSQFDYISMFDEAVWCMSDMEYEGRESMVREFIIELVKHIELLDTWMIIGAAYEKQHRKAIEGKLIGVQEVLGATRSWWKSDIDELKRKLSERGMDYGLD